MELCIFTKDLNHIQNNDSTVSDQMLEQVLLEWAVLNKIDNI